MFVLDTNIIAVVYYHYKHKITGQEGLTVEVKQFMTIRETAKYTGISESYIRDGVKNKRIPYIPVGNRAMINIALFQKQMDAQSMEVVSGS